MRWCWVVKGDGSNAKQWWVVTSQWYSTKNKHKTIKYTQKQAKKEEINIVCPRRIVHLMQKKILFAVQCNGNHIKP
jgi:hypothetical protein